MKENLFDFIEDQAVVCFTGRLNVLLTSTKQHLGHILFFEGKVINAYYKGGSEVKAFYSIMIDRYNKEDMTLIIEPEIVHENQTKIHYPLSVLRKKVLNIISNYKIASEQRPPGHLRLEVKADFMRGEEEVSREEFEVLCTIISSPLVDDVYANSKLVEFEITNSLISLRKKNAIKVLKINKEVI